LRFLLRGQTSSGRLPDKSRITYWNPVYRPDTSGDQTGQSDLQNRIGMRIKRKLGKT
jgi:hypothetical protein